MKQTTTNSSGSAAAPRNIWKIIRILVDSAMFILFLLLMGYHLFENLHHEIMGAAVFCLFIIHNILNRRWYQNLFKGKYTAGRILQTVVNLLLCAAMLCTITGALMISRHVFYFLGLMSSAAGRRLHMAGTVWAFLLSCMHLGLHWKAKAGYIWRAVLLAVCVYGAYAFYTRALWNEMFLLTEFKFFDFEESPLHFFTDFASISVLFTAAGFYLKQSITYKSRAGGIRTRDL